MLNLFQHPAPSRAAVRRHRIEHVTSTAGRPWIFEKAQVFDPQPDVRMRGETDPETSSG
jgi:hypothetical protein